MGMTYEFFRACELVASRQHSFPAKIRSIIYDPRFSSESVYEDVRSGVDLSAIDIPRFYDKVFDDLNFTTDHFNCFSYVCDSEDLQEPIERGEFLYYAGMITSSIGVIYMRSSHPWALPSRAILTSPTIQVSVSNDLIDVDITPVNERLHRYLMIQDEKERSYHIKEFLMNSDRPYIDPTFICSVVW